MVILASSLVVLLLIAINALYVAGEFASVSVRPARVEAMADEGNLWARRLLPMLRDTTLLDNYVAACQIGITASSLMLGAFGESAFGPPLAQALLALGAPLESAYGVAAVAVLLMLSTLQMVLGELLPKAIALRYPLQTAFVTVIPVGGSMRLFKAFIKLLNGSAIGILKLLRVDHQAHRHVHSAEEIGLILSETSASGAMAPEDVRRLHNALLLGKGSAQQLMVPRDSIAALPLHLKWDDMLATIAQSPYTRFPVYGNDLDDVRGVIDTKHIAMRALDGHGPPRIEQLLRPVAKVDARTPADRLLSVFRAEHTQMLLVVNEAGRVEGLVTLEDALTELMGDVPDEFKSRRRRRRAPAGAATEGGAQ